MPEFNRRRLLKVAGAATVAAAGASTLVQLTAAGAPADSASGSFREVYRGRLIESRTARRKAAPEVLIDGVALHVMINADGTYTSLINHYESFESLREVATAAVDHLGDAPLLPVDHHHN